MEAVRETTIWEGATQPNHIYLLDGTKAVAYIKFGKGDPFYFKNPIAIDKRGRKFEKLKTNPFKELDKVKGPAATIEVQGSKGQTYFVNIEERTCSCPGFTYRGTCKHVTEKIAA